MGTTREKLMATIVGLLEKTLTRVGNAEYAEQVLRAHHHAPQARRGRSRRPTSRASPATLPARGEVTLIIVKSRRRNSFIFRGWIARCTCVTCEKPNGT